jgi:hypothetical protein
MEWDFMWIIKKIYYVIKNKYHECEMCKGSRYLPVKTKLSSYMIYHGYSVSAEGEIFINCLICKGTGIKWG